MRFGKIFNRFRGVPEHASICGHAVQGRKMRVEAFGEHVELESPVNDDGIVPFCASCLAGMTIRCAWCEQPIFISNMITLYSPRRGDRAIPMHATILSAQNRQLVGCERTSCAMTGADYCGFWIPSGRMRNGRWIGGVRPFKSALERALESGQPMIVNDIHADAVAHAEQGVLLPARMALAA